MTSEPMRDPVTDHLLTSRNSALVVIDYQPDQMQVMTSIDREVLVDNMVSVTRLARTYDLPVVLSTVNAANGQGNTLPEIKAALPDTPEIDRTTMNAWEDVEFRQAVEATGRKKLIMTALWTEICLTFPTLDALRDGFEIYPVVDAVGGTSPEAHRAALERIVQAGARPIAGSDHGRTTARLGARGHRRRARRHRADDPPACGRVSTRDRSHETERERLNRGRRSPAHDDVHRQPDRSAATRQVRTVHAEAGDEPFEVWARRLRALSTNDAWRIAMPKAVVLTKYGPPDVLVWKDVARPEPGPRQVRIRVKSAGVSPTDPKIRRGDVQAVFRLPADAVLGFEAAGVVDRARFVGRRGQERRRSRVPPARSGRLRRIHAHFFLDPEAR